MMTVIVGVGNGYMASWWLL